LNEPSPNLRVKRCVTLNELPKRGIRRVVGSATIVKSGCDGFTARSLGACGGGAGSCAAASGTYDNQAIKRNGRIARGKIDARRNLGSFIGYGLM
jgi:hypothetical protein